MSAQCVRCRRPMADQAYACSPCTHRAGEQLHAIADMIPAARSVACGQDRRGDGGSSGKTSPNLELNLAATARLDAIQNELTTWARHIAAERGRAGTTARQADPIVAAAEWLLGQGEWIRHRPEAFEYLAGVETCARVVAGIVRGPAPQRFLGPCGATLREQPAEDGCPVNCACHNGPHYACDEPGGCGSAGCGQAVLVETEPCEGDVYAYLDADAGRCKACGATYPTAERQAWLQGEVREHAFEAADIAEAYGVNVKTIRTWASRPRAGAAHPPLRSYWRTESGIVADWVDPPDGEKRERLHYVGDVLDLAAADAARRGTEQATRARRAAARAAETERMSA